MTAPAPGDGAPAAEAEPTPADGAEVTPRHSRTILPRRRGRPLWQELPLLLILSFGLAVLVKTFLVQAFYIPSASMEQTLVEGDRVLVSKLSYRLRDVRRGEIVVFRGPDSWKEEFVGPPPPSNPIKRLLRPVGRALGAAPPGEKDFIKRVIGVPGDEIACCNRGRVTVNGKPLDETDYLFEDDQKDFKPVQVGPGQLWVMGDHRSVSHDSRANGQGTIPTDNVIGRAFVVVWPIGHFRGLGRPETGAGARDLGLASRPLAVATSPLGLGVAAALPIVGVRRRRRLRAAA